MRSNNGVKFKKLINTDCRQTAAWGGNIINLEEELKNLCSQGYCTVVLAGSEKTLPIINKDLNDAGISGEILTGRTKQIIAVRYLRTGCLSGGLIILI